ncbi:MAG: bacillithiol biosynthesis cysteine-adding enzyme BshC [Verrucomicrobia bacterium]|nr:bacillithiol biosynthesis cysteine-adding enzyme BshC [Cytophagales bacterium]
MHIHTLPLSETKQFSSFLTDYLSQRSDLEPFYQYFPSLENFEKQIQITPFTQEKRKILHQTLINQYADYQLFPKQTIDDLLLDNTFTVTTGHQLNIFSGPLYVIYKLVSVINLVKILKQKYPDYHFVPVYWMATEDHDFEEINHFELFGKKYSWETQQSGAVGSMNPEEISEIFAQMPEKVPVFEKAYLEHETLADATRFWVNELFGNENLICLDANDKALKNIFKEIIKADIFEHKSLQLFENQSVALEKAGYPRQINAREINFFYLERNSRERVVKNGENYEILNTGLVFNAEQMLALVEKSPERFSPNVVLRPVYQQVVLPNISYTGGPAELAYWFQLKSIFDFFEVSYPILLPRNFALYVNATNAKKIEKLGVNASDLFAEETELRKDFVAKNTENPIDLKEEFLESDKIFEKLVHKALKTDASLEGFVKAERQKVLASLENIEKRFKKAEEQKQATQISQLLSLKTKLFPHSGLQERNDNFLNFYLNNPDFLQTLLDNFDPLCFDFYIFTEETNNPT